MSGKVNPSVWNDDVISCESCGCQLKRGDKCYECGHNKSDDSCECQYCNSTNLDFMLENQS